METRRVRGARHDGDGRVLSGRGGAECPSQPRPRGTLGRPARAGWQVQASGSPRWLGASADPGMLGAGADGGA